MDWKLSDIYYWPAFVWKHPNLTQAIKVAFLLVLAWAVVKILRRILPPIFKRSLNRQVAHLLQNTIFIAIWILAIIQMLSVYGVDVVSILGAAGVVGIAIGFASQTSLSNLISGIFLVGEKSVKLGDWVQIDGFGGSIESIDLLSVKIRTADNSLVRIPNETLIKTPVQNMTQASLRRCDFDIGVDYSSDIARVRQIIQQVVAQQESLVKNPAPAVQFVAFADSSLTIHVGAWCKTPDYGDARFEFARNILEAFRKEGVNIPFPIRTIDISSMPGAAAGRPDARGDAPADRAPFDRDEAKG